MELTKSKFTLFAAHGRKSFVNSEIKWLLKLYPESNIVTLNPEGDLKNDPRIIPIQKAFSSNERSRHIKHRWPEIIVLLLMDTFSRGTSPSYIFRLRFNLSILIQCSMICESLFDQQRGLRETKAYSFFANDYALVLALAAKRGHLKSFGMRAHGRDVIEEREPKTQKLAFQWLKYKYAAQIYCVSKATQHYLKSKYPASHDKFGVSYLGSKDLGIGPLTSGKSTHNIVSVGRVRNVKRFFLIAEMLMHTKVSIKWTHFGDIQDSDPTTNRYQSALQKLQSQKNVEIDQRGFVNNEDLLDYYQSEFVDLLINSSDFEGLPVSIQEAISFGIPCMATDVGGTADIVNEKTGVLIDSNFNPEQVATELEGFLTSKSRDSAYRKGVRKFWEEHFDAGKNYPAFFKNLERDLRD